MKRKLFLFVLVPFVSAVFATDPTWTTPSKVAVATFHVNNYSNYYHSGVDNLYRAHLHRNMFYNTLSSKIQQKYPGKNVFPTYHCPDGGSNNICPNVSKNDYRDAQLYHSEFVFFSGHGNQQQIYLSDYPINLSSGCGHDNCADDQCGKIYGGDIRWVVLDACLTLNVNFDGQLDLPLTAETVDLSKVDKLREVFGGVHAVLGFYSTTWEDYRVYYSLYGNPVRETENMYFYFANYFIDEEETIWDSFNLASADIVDDFSIFDNRGLMPAIAFLRGYDADGRYHDTSMERFNHTFNQPIQINGTLELFVMYDIHGEPEFDTPDEIWF